MTAPIYFWCACGFSVEWNLGQCHPETRDSILSKGVRNFLAWHEWEGGHK